MDVFSVRKRSTIMSRIKGRNTGLEVGIRKLLRSTGHEFKRHVKSLPGCPDIVVSHKKKIIFVNGCFWHGHRNCVRAKLPAVNRGFWIKKIKGNMKRDAKIKKQLRSMGWGVLEIWGCKTDKDYLNRRLEKFMSARTLIR